MRILFHRRSTSPYVHGSRASLFSLLSKGSACLLGLIWLATPVLAQDGSIAGQVVEAATGEAIPGVNVALVGTTVGTTTDVQGRYEIGGVEPGAYEVQASFIGYETTVIADVQVEAGATATVDIEMAEETLGLDEVVVTGYGQQRRRELTGAISSVDAEELSEVTVSSLDQALQGRVTGVTISPNSGKPGDAVQINIRGVGTFGNNNPLYVIDGVPVFNSASGLGLGQSNPLSTLDPSSIESLEILKDASATAIYGARAANGVVLITTKRGRPGATRVSFTASAGVQNVYDRIPVLNSREYAELAEEADVAGFGELTDANANLFEPERLNQNTDWQDEAFDSAPVQDYGLTVSGGSEAANYAVILNYFDQQGTLPDNGFTRYSARVNTDFKIGDRIRFGESASISRGNWSGGFEPASDFIQELLQSAPTYPVRDPNNLGGFAGPRSELSGRNNRSNRIAEMILIDNLTQQNRLLGNIYGELDVLEGLTARLNAGGDFLYGEANVFNPRFELGNRSSSTATLNENRRTENTYLLEGTLSYTNSFGAHTVDAVTGYSQQESSIDDVNGSIQDFPNNNVRVINAGFGQSNLSGGAAEWAIRSFLARVNYSFQDRYLLTATFRRDGSSRFGPNNRFGNFPSFSIGWIASEEAFLQDVAWLSNLKVRGSWGQVGNQEIPNYAWISTIEPAARYVLGGNAVPGATYLGAGNPDLKWETTTQTDVGMDLDLFDYRLTLAVDLFRKDTDDILLRLPVAATSGFRPSNGPVRNAGKVRNEGIEFSAEYREATGDFQYTISANFSTIRNEVLSLGGGAPVVDRLQSDPNFATTITEVGGPIGAFYGHVMEGLFQEGDFTTDDEGNFVLRDGIPEQGGAAPGDIRFQDRNNDGIINDDDRQVIGNPFPDFTYGLRGNFRYKGWDLTMFVDGVQGRDLYFLLYGGIMDLEGDNNSMREALNRWTPQNTDTDVPRAVANDPNDNKRPSTRFIEDGSFIRLRSVQIGYRLPQRLTQRLSAERLRFYVTGQNLFTGSDYPGYTPDIGSAGARALTSGVDIGIYPIPTTFTLGLQADF